MRNDQEFHDAQHGDGLGGPSYSLLRLPNSVTPLKKPIWRLLIAFATLPPRTADRRSRSDVSGSFPLQKLVEAERR